MFVNYSVVRGESITIDGALIELVKEVRQMMSHGWTPMGGAFYCGKEWWGDEERHVFAQTIVKMAPPIGDTKPSIDYKTPIVVR